MERKNENSVSTKTKSLANVRAEVKAKVKAKVKASVKVNMKTNPITYLKNIMYVDADNICHENIKIQQGHMSENNIRYYDIRYLYGDVSHNQLEGSLNILCKDLMLSQKRYGAYIYGNNNCALPLNTHADTFHLLSNFIQMVRTIAIDHILAQNIPMMDLEAVTKLREKRIGLEMMRKGKLCKIIKLGSKSENHVNSQVRSIEEFNKLMRDYRYNKPDTDSFYVADLIIGFRCCVYRRENKQHIIDKQDNPNIDKLGNPNIDKLGNPNTDPYNTMISFVPYLKLMEMRYNRAECIPMINTDDKIIGLDNVLVL